MRVVIAGGGNVGQSIAGSLVAAGHQVLVIEKVRANYRPETVPAADWMLADACELSALQSAQVQTADVAIAATGDDKANLVFAMLCKTEFAIARVVARVNDPGQEWLFGPSFGIDVAVSTPRTMVASVGEAVSDGSAVRLMTLERGQGSVVGLTLTAGSALVGRPAADLPLPAGAALLGVIAGGVLRTPEPGLITAAGDEIVLLTGAGDQERIRAELEAG
ncbi:MAG: TrkA family potassium uptake protein [Jatrophihabitans sp.]|nr:MAG: TrkA family potassium uptake protein [Jatrophihabitans sp.]